MNVCTFCKCVSSVSYRMHQIAQILRKIIDIRCQVLCLNFDVVEHVRIDLWNGRQKLSIDERLCFTVERLHAAATRFIVWPETIPISFMMMIIRYTFEKPVLLMFYITFPWIRAGRLDFVLQIVGDKVHHIAIANDTLRKRCCNTEHQQHTHTPITIIFTHTSIAV